MALQYFILTIPSIVDQLGPIFILLSGVISLGILNHSNELVALKAGGVPLRLIIRPLLLGSVFFTILFVLAAEFVLPITVAKTNNLWFEQLKGKVMVGIIRNGRYYYKGKNGFYSFKWPNKNKYEFQYFSFSQWDENYNIKTLTTARTAYWDETTDQWILLRVQIQEQGEEKEYQITNFKKKQLTLPEHPKDFLVPANKAAELSLSGLYREIERSDVEHETRAAWTIFLGKISYIFLGLPLLLLGLPILLYSYRTWGRDLSLAIPVSCGIAFVAWGIWGALQSLSIAGYISPIVAACSIHIVFALTGVFLLIKNDR